MIADHQFLVVDRATAAGQPLIAEGVEPHPWQYAIYRRTAAEFAHTYGEMIALCHDKDEANILAASLNATCAFLNSMMGDKT